MISQCLDLAPFLGLEIREIPSQEQDIRELR